MGRSKRGGAKPTHEWRLLVPLFEWPEQERYEEIRPLVLFDASVAERAQEVGTSASTLYRWLDRFAEEGMESLFDAPTATRKRLPPAIRRLVVDLKAEYPAFSLNEIANVVRAAFGRKPDVRSVGRVLEEEPLPLKMVRRYPPYHDTGDAREARAAVVTLRLDGWSAKAIAGYLGVHHATVYRALQRWKENGFEGLADGSPSRPPGVRKADFAAVEAIRRLARNPGLGAFRVLAAMRQMGFDLSRAGFARGRILAQVREVYGYEKPQGGGGTTRSMPFAASERHSRVIDALGYATLMRWRLYAEEGLAGREADLWLLEKTLTVEHAGEPLSAYEVRYDAAGGRGGSEKLLGVGKPTLFETPFVPGQMRHFALAETLGEEGWLKVFRREDYAPRRSPGPGMMQPALFPYAEAWG